MLKSIKANWKRAVSGLLAVVMAAGMLSDAAFAAGVPVGSPVTDTASVYAPTGDFELNVAGATAWNGGDQALIVYKAESGSAKNTTIRDAVPFALLDDNGGDRIKIGYVADGPWTGSTMDATGWADKDNILVNLPDVIPSISYDRDTAKQFNQRLTRHEYVIAGTYALAEQLAQLQKSAMSAGDTLVVRQSSQTVSVSRAKGDPAQLHSYSLDGAAYQKYDAWTEYEDQDDSLSDLSYELPYSINRAFSADPSITLTMFCPQTVRHAPALLSADDPTGGVGAYNPGSPGGKKPGTSNVAWSTDPERTFLRFTLLEFPQGVVTDLNTNDWGTWHVLGTPLNVVWSKGSDGDTWSVDKCRSDITWYNSCAMQYNGQGDNAPQLMEGTVYSYDATANPRWVTTADAFQAATGISDEEKEQMFHCNSSSWSTGWRDGDYTSMWGTDAESITPGNPYKVYEANDAFIYLLGQLSGGDSGPGWSADEAMEKWSEYVHDADGNLRTKYRIIVETGCIFKDPDGYRRAMTLREMMAYSLYNSEGSGQYTLIYDQSSTSVNMANWMYQGKDNQFLEYPLDESGAPTGEELHSTNGFKEAESLVGGITYGRAIRDTIFSNRVSFGLHIFSPFNFESEEPDKPILEVTKKVTTGISADEEFGFTVKYTAGSPAGFTATKNGADCTSQVTSTGDGLKFKLKADETIHIEFDADASFRCEVTEDDSSNLTGITGTGGAADITAKKFTTTSGIAKATFTNGTTPPPPDIPDDPDDPPPGTSILYKRDANTNAGVGPATFKFSSVVNGVYEFDTDRTGTLETIQWWDPTEAAGKYIKPGEYAVSEIIPPPNYMPTTEVQQIKLELDADGNPIPAGPLVFKNLPKVGLRILKYDRLTHRPMNGVTFEIFRDGVSIGRYETNGNGEILLTDIEPGTYRAVEVETGDESHIMNGSYQEIELIAGEGIKDLVFFNDVKPGMKLVKVDSANPAKTISGAKFSIRAVEGTYGTQEFITNGNGEIDLSMLPEGSYEVTEVECAGYIIDDAQRIIHLKANDTVEFVFTNTKEPELTISKIDADTNEPVPGTVFTIKSLDGDYQDDWTTGADGKVTKSVAPGTYQITEKSVPAPYYLPDKDADRIQTITLNPGDEKTLLFRNYKAPELTIYKEDSLSGESLAGAKFHVTYTSNGESAEAPASADYGYLLTDENGEINLHEEGKRLYPGEFTITEITPPPGYQMKEPSTQKVIIHGGESKRLVFQNEPLNEIIVEKYDSVTGEVVPGCTFQLRFLGGDISGTGGTVISQKVTDETGTAIWTGLAAGTYILDEVEPADGYNILQSSETIYLADNGEKKVITIRMENAPDGSLLIRKVCSVNPSVALQDAEFKVTYSDGTLVGDSNGIYRTDVNGEILITGLTPGKTVVVTETRAPDGFIIDSQSQTIQIKAGAAVSLTFKNQPKGQLIVQKRDSVSGQPLPGAEFRVTTAAGCEVGLDGVIGTSTLTQNGIFTTDAQGEIRITNLAPGAYVLTEIKAPDGYIMDSPSTNVVIGTNGDTQMVIVKNTPKGGLLVKKMDSATKEPLADVLFKITRTDGTVVGTSNGEYRTDERGFISLPELEPGSYIVQEVQTKAGYLLDGTPHVVAVKDHQTYTLEVFNQPLGNLIINKLSSADNTPLEGVKFEIKYADGRVVDNQNGQMSSNGLYTTDSNGQIIISGITGTVVVTELETIPGYVIDQNTRTQTVTINPADTQTLKFYNEPLCSLTLLKLDSVTRKPIADTEFTVREGNGGLIGRYVTEENGTATVTGLIPNSTVVVYESRVPDGYVLNPMPQTITVSNSGIGGSVTGAATTGGNSLTFVDDPTMTLTIHKYIEGTANKPLAGVAFKVVDGNGAPLNPDGGIYYTNYVGEIVLGGLEPGMTITAQEVKTVDGYVLDGTPQSIKIKAGAAQNLTFWNSPAGTLVIQKKDKISGAAIAGAEFQLTYANGGYVDNDNGHLSSNGIYTTDSKGEIRITGVVGTIVAKETKAAPGYVIDQSNQTQTVTVNPQETQTLTFFNVPTNTLTIQKYVDGTANEPLAGVEFLVTDSSGAVVGPNNGYYTTDRNGCISISGLTPGMTITARETKTVDGYILDGAPQSILIKEGEPLSLTFWNKKAGGLIVNKIDAVTKKPLTGVKFKITYADGSNVDMDGGKTSSNGIYTTDTMGQIKIPGIVGTVIVEEIETVSGYYIDPNTKSQTVQVSANDTQTLTFTNAPTQSLVIQKLEAGTKDQPLAGVEFLITDSSGAAIGPNDGVYRTDAQGRITITDLIPGTVITAREVKTLEGYVLDGTPQSREIKSGEVQSMTFYNEKAGTLVVQKKDKFSGALIAGAQFQLTYATGGYVDNDNGHLSSNGLYVTDANGEIRISGIIGTVVAKEVQAAPGYVIDQATQTQTAKVDPMDTKTLVFLNEPLCNLTLRKLDSVTGKPIPGTEFTVKDSNGTVIGQYVTDDDGTVVVTGLIPGNTYVVYESRVPDGYVLNPTPQTITVTNGTGNGVTSGGTSSGASGGTVTGTGNSLTFTDDPKMTLTIHKYIEGTANEPLAGVAFKVVDGSGKPLNPNGGIYYTNNAGEIILEGLEPGMTITAQEIKTVDGYVLDGNPQSIKIEAGKAQNLTFWNKPAGSLIIRKLDKQSGEPLAGVEFELMYAEGGYVDNANGHLSSNGRYTTDDHGEIHISGVTGTIVVKETRPLPNYTIEAGREQQTVTVKPQETQTLTFYNIPANNLTIQKYIDGTNNEPLAGVEFLVTDSSGAVVGPNNGYYTTDKDGRISIPGLTPGITVTVKETKTVDGYVLDANPQSILIKEGEAQSITFWNKKAGGLIVNKIDAVSKGPLAGVKFKVTYADGSNVDMDGGKTSSNGIYTTDSMGQIKISGIVGTVVVEEIETISGYYIDPNAKSQTVQVNANDTQTLTFSNAPMQSLVIQKLEAGTKDQPLAGVEFLITDSSGAFVGPNDGIYKTDAQGRITITDLIPGTVITAKEVKTLEGYVLDGTPQSREIKSGEVQVMTFYNQKAGTLVVQKKDKFSGTLIAGAQFQISYLTGEFVTSGDSSQSNKGLYVTDNAGEIRISGITGTVVVKEIQAASGYVIDQSTQTQTVTVNPMDTQTLVFLNEPLCSLTLSKLDSVTGKPVPGTEFTVKDTNGTIIGRYVTGEDGTVVVTGLIPGNTYVVNESRVPAGYVLNPTPKTITVTNGTGNGVTSDGTTSGGTVTGTGNSLTFTDDPKMTLTIHKYIEGTANEPLAGVAFKVVDGSGAPLNPNGGIYYTNNAGEIILEGLEPGMTITAQEIKTVDGYVLDGNPQSIKIEAGKGQNLTFWNKPAGSLVIRKLDKQTGEPLAGVEFELMYAEGGYVDNANGHLSSNGRYTTDDHGEIHISGVTGTIMVKETRPLPNYTIEAGREQQTVTVKPQETQTITFFNIPANTLTIQKYIDGTNNEPLAGVEFLVTDSTGAVVGPNNGYYTTDKDGRISIPGLTPGTTITVKETKTLDGYVLDGSPQSIVIKEGEAQSVTFWNKKAGGLIVNKIDAVTKEPLVGVKFKVTYADGSNVDMDGGKTSSNGIYITDSMGQIKITGIVGTIVVEEIETISGYYIDPNAKSQTVQINADDTQTITFANAPTQSLVIQKLEAGTKDQPLAGVEFLITDSSGAFVGPNDGIYKTDTQGRITITDLIPGTVITAKEVKTLEGYVLDGTPQSREIKSGEAQMMTFYNEKAGTLVVQKKDKFSGALIAGAQFQLTYATGGFVDADNGHLSSNGLYTTDAAGEIRISGITGTVVVKEIQAASGYVIDQSTQTQTVTVNPMDTQTLVFLNEPLCSLTLSKLDSVTGKPVPGTEFTVKDGNGTIIGQYVTGEDGTVVVTGLIPGNTYVVHESRVPAGYVLNPTPKTITVSNGTGNGVTNGGTVSGGAVNGTVTGTGNSLTFADDPKMTLTIHKYIEGTANEPLAGVAFKVTESNGTPVGSGDGVFYTDNAGEIVVEGLEPGVTVTAQEIKTVDGFVLDGTPKSVKITADAQAPELVFWNKLAGSLVIRKLDKQTNKPLAGVEFELMYAEGGYVDNANGHLSSNGRYTTDDHGEIHISGVTGTIVVKETRPLSGYTIEPGMEQQIVTVKPQETQTLTFYNIPANTLMIQKYIDGTDNEPLAGVEFLVTDSTGAVVGSNNGYYITDKDGRISIPGLTPGTTITVKETKTVDGYVLDGNPQTIIIKEGEAQTLTFWNAKAGGLVVNKIDAVTKEPLAGVKFRITYADGSNVDMDGGRTGTNGIYTTDTTGQIKILGIVGTVVVEEIETIPGYIIDPNAKSQTVQVNANSTQTVTFTNAPKKALTIQKFVDGTTDPIQGVTFLVTDSSGQVLGPNNGEYVTDQNGRIVISDLTPGVTITVKEVGTVSGYVLDTTPQSILIKEGEAQTLTFFNKTEGGLELIKVSESDKSQRIPGVTFEIRKMDGGLVTTVTTDSTGRVHTDLDAGDYYAVETEAARGFKLDATPTYFTVQDGKTTTVTITNKPFSGILIHKTDSVTGKGIYGVIFLLYDSTNTPIGQYTSDNSGYVYIENLTASGRYYLRELENAGYIPDTQMKTVYVTAGETTLIEWKNTPITAQIQITKKSADYNPTNGLPAGTLLEGAIFEIYDKANNLVDTIQSDSRGLAVSSPLPLGRYTIREVKAPDNYGISGADLTAYLEHEGEIVRFEVTNKALATGVSITKTGPAEAMAGQPVRYVFSDIANSSNVRLDNFYWRDTLPAEVRLDSIVTGTYNFSGTYKITYRVNGGENRTLADNLSTQKNYTLAASATALGLASNERVTEIMFVFGQAPAGFAQVEKSYIYCTAVANITSTSFVNVADVGGTYNGVWVQAVSRWVTKVYGKPTPLPRTGY